MADTYALQKAYAKNCTPITCTRSLVEVILNVHTIIFMNTNYKKALGFVVALGLVVASSASAASAPMTFSRNLSKGATGADVKQLQQLLNSCTDTQLSSAAGTAGSAGFETMYFGPATVNAVKAYQTKNGIAPVLGNFFALTRAAAASVGNVCGGTTPTPTPTPNQTGPITVSLASTNPASNYIVAGQAGARLAEFTFSGNGTVTNLTLQKIGLSNNSTLENVYLYDGMTRLTDANSVRTDGSIVFNAPSGLFTVSGSKTITVKTDICTTTNCPNVSGQTVGIAVTSVNVMGSTAATSVSGVNGNLFSTASTTTANVTFTSQGVTANTGVIIPRNNYSIWNVATNVSTNNVNLKGLALDMVGSADASALSNVTLYVDGMNLKSTNVMAVNGNKRVIFDLSSTPKLLATGGHTIEVRADVVSGATRDFTMKLMSLSDIILEDVIVSNVGVSVGSTGYGLYKDAGKQTLTGASNTSVNIFKDTSYTTTNITPGASNVTLGKFKLTAYGEDTKIQTVVVTPTVSVASKPGNIGLYVNGSQVGNTISNNPVTTTWTFNLGSNFIANAGVEYAVEIRGNAMDSISGAAITSGTVFTTVNSVTGVGQYSQSSFTNTSAPVGQTLTFGGGNYAVGNVLSGFNSTVSPNASDAKIASFSVQAGTTEGADVRTFAISIGGSGSATYLSNVKLVDAATGAAIAPAQPGGSSMSFTPSGTFIVPAGQTRTVNLVANVGNQTTTTTVIPTLTVTGYGQSSNQLLTFVGSPLTGTTVTYTNAVTGTPSVSSKLNSQYVIGGGTQSVGTYNFTSTNGASTINDLAFTTSGTAGAVSSVTINGVTVSPIGTAVTFTGLNINVPAGNNGVNLPVTVAYSSAYVGSGSGVPTGSPATLTLTGMKATANGGSPVVTGTVNGTTNGVLSVATNAMTLVSSMSVVAKAGTPSSIGVNASPQTAQKIGSIKVSADAAGDIMVGTLSYTLSAPATLSNVVVKVGGTQALDTAGNAPGTCNVTICTFTAGYRISAGTTVQFDIFADVAAVTAAGTLDASVGSAASFLWSDDVTTAGTGLSGTLLPSSKYQQ